MVSFTQASELGQEDHDSKGGEKLLVVEWQPEALCVWVVLLCWVLFPLALNHEFCSTVLIKYESPLAQLCNNSFNMLFLITVVSHKYMVN